MPEQLHRGLKAAFETYTFDITIDRNKIAVYGRGAWMNPEASYMPPMPPLTFEFELGNISDE